jgi:hypothetical protein
MLCVLKVSVKCRKGNNICLIRFMVSRNCFPKGGIKKEKEAITWDTSI